MKIHCSTLRQLDIHLPTIQQLEIHCPGLGTAHKFWPLAKLHTQAGCWASSPRPSQSYSVQSCLPLAAAIGPAGRSRVFSIESGKLQAESCPSAIISYSTIYPTPRTQSSLARYSARKLAISSNSTHNLAVGPPALSHHNPTVCSLACRWRLQ